MVCLTRPAVNCVRSLELKSFKWHTETLERQEKFKLYRILSKETWRVFRVFGGISNPLKAQYSIQAYFPPDINSCSALWLAVSVAARARARFAV